MSIKSMLFNIAYADTLKTRESSRPSYTALQRSLLQAENEILDLKVQLKDAQALIFELKTRLGENESRIVDLEKERKKRQKNPLGQNTPSSKQNFKENSPEDERQKRGGAKKGHKGYGRRKLKDDQIDREVVLSKPLSCSCCGGKEIGQGRSFERDIIDIPLDSVEKIRYRVEHGTCLVCGEEMKQDIGALPRCSFSTALLSRIAIDHYVSGISLGTILSGLKLGDKLGGITAALHRLGDMSESAYQKIVADYRQASVRHADETGWRTDGKGGYAWGFFSSAVSLFVVGVSRSSATVKKIFGETALAGCLVVDRYAGYNKVPCKIQYCFAHLDRDVLADRDEFEDQPEVFDFTTQLSNLLKESMILRGKNISDAHYLAEAARIKTDIYKLCDDIKSSHLCIKSWKDFFKENEDRLFVFVTDRNIPCENNLAERELRRLVIARKVSFGSQSEKGARTRQHLMTLLHTAKKRLDPKDDLAVWLKNALDDYNSGKIADLYDALPTVK